MRVLIIAGNEIEQTVLKLVLNKLQVQSDLDDRGMNAVRLCEEHAYDYIFLDISSFDFSRIDIFNMIADRTSPTSPKFIAITNDRSREERNTFYGLGFTAYISKPYSLQTIQQVITI